MRGIYYSLVFVEKSIWHKGILEEVRSE